MSTRSEALARRILEGADALATLARRLDPREWRAPLPGDGRTVGVVVHHVATLYPVEVELARVLAAGSPIEGITPAVLHEMNAEHARENAGALPDETITLLLANAADAAASVREFTDEELDRAAPVSLNGDAPLTAQFFIEDHALRHSFHHLAGIRKALARA